MKRIFVIFLWIIPFVLLVAGISYRFWWQPEHNLNKTIQNQTENLLSLSSNLNQSTEVVKTTPSPSTIVVSSGKMKEYSTKIKEAADSIELTGPSMPPPYMLVSNRRASSFNALTQDPAYKEAINMTYQAASNNKALLAHHSGVMQALANMLAYDPAHDLSPTNPDALALRLDQAIAGLQKTETSLKSAPAYHNDTTQEQLVGLVQEAQAAAESTKSSLESGGFETQKQLLISTFSRVQKEVIANRVQFWSHESKKLITDAGQALRSLDPYLNRLKSL